VDNLSEKRTKTDKITELTPEKQRENTIPPRLLIRRQLEIPEL